MRVALRLDCYLIHIGTLCHEDLEDHRAVASSGLPTRGWVSAAGPLPRGSRRRPTSRLLIQKGWPLVGSIPLCARDRYPLDPLHLVSDSLASAGPFRGSPKASAAVLSDLLQGVRTFHRLASAACKRH